MPFNSKLAYNFSHKKTLDGFNPQIINLTPFPFLKIEWKFALYMHMANSLPISGQEIPFRNMMWMFQNTVDVFFSACTCAYTEMNLKNLLGLILT